MRSMGIQAGRGKGGRGSEGGGRCWGLHNRDVQKNGFGIRVSGTCEVCSDVNSGGH